MKWYKRLISSWICILSRSFWYIFLFHCIDYFHCLVFDFNENIDKFTTNHASRGRYHFRVLRQLRPLFFNLFSPLFVFISVIFFTSKLAENSGLSP